MMMKNNGKIKQHTIIDENNDDDTNTDNDEDDDEEEVQNDSSGKDDVDVDANANADTSTTHTNNHLSSSSLFHRFHGDMSRRFRTMGMASIIIVASMLLWSCGGELPVEMGRLSPPVAIAVELSSSAPEPNSSSSTSSSTSSSASSSTSSRNSPGSSMSRGERYWSIMSTSTTTTHDDDDTNNDIKSIHAEERVQANKALIDYAVGTINTQYYDNTGGWNFTRKLVKQH